MHKKDVPGAILIQQKDTDGILPENRDFIVLDAAGPLYGNQSLTDYPGVSTGSECGLQRAVQSDCFPNCQAIAASS
jgi:hypothetical protein